MSEQILKMLEREHPTSAGTICARMYHYDPRTVYRWLRRMTAAGLIRRQGTLRSPYGGYVRG